MTFTPTANWRRAMERAIRAGLKATRCVDGTYRVPSVSHPGAIHSVIVNDAGHITYCSDCMGWDHGQRAHPCKHAGAVALALTYLGGHSNNVARSEPIMQTAASSKRQLFRAEV
jgi:hypothetical protein